MSLTRLNVLEEMREKLECRKLVMQKMSLRAKAAAEDSKKKEDELGAEVQSFLVAGAAFQAAQKRLQVPLNRHHLNCSLLDCLPFDIVMGICK